MDGDDCEFAEKESTSPVVNAVEDKCGNVVMLSGRED